MRLSLGPDLTTARSVALAEVDAASAGASEAIRPARLAVMDAARLAEATQLLEARDSDGAYPMLRAMAGGGDLFDRARAVIDAARTTTTAQLALESRRLAAKASIRAAASHPAIREIVRNHGEST